RSDDQVSRVEDLVANGAGDGDHGQEIGTGDLHVEAGNRQLALGLADVGSVHQELRGDSHGERVQVQVDVFLDGSSGVACDNVGVATEEIVDPVLGLDDVLPDDQPFALVLANLGQETLDGELGEAGGILHSLGEPQALLLKLDDVVEVLEPFIER